MPACVQARHVGGRGGRAAATALVVALVASAISCEPTTGPNPYEAWSADLTGSAQVLFMGFARRGEAVTGNAELSDLLAAGPGERMSLSGTRRGDSLDIAFRRPFGGSYRFVGRYVAGGAGLTGTLDGGAFVQVAVNFRR